jgi:hypothetical protein
MKDLFVSYKVSQEFVSAGLVQEVKPTQNAILYVKPDGGPCFCYSIYQNLYGAKDLLTGETITMALDMGRKYIPAVSYADVMGFLQILSRSGIEVGPIFGGIESLANIILAASKQILVYKREQEYKEKYRLTRIGGKIEHLVKEESDVLSDFEIVKKIKQIIEKA